MRSRSKIVTQAPAPSTDAPQAAELVAAIVMVDFTDAGPNESFAVSDAAIDIEKGRFLNFEAAGLVRAA